MSRISLSAAVLAAGVLFCTAASAAAKTLDLTWEFTARQLAPSENVTLVNDANVTIASKEGQIVCMPEGPHGLAARDRTNNQKVNELDVYSPRSIEKEYPHCASTMPQFPSEAAVTLLPEKVARGLMSLRASGKAGLRMARPSEEPVVFISGPRTVLQCSYVSAKGLRGKLILHPFEGHQLMEVSFVRQKLDAVGTLQKSCPKVSLTLPLGYAFTEPEPGVTYDIFAQIL